MKKRIKIMLFLLLLIISFLLICCSKVKNMIDNYNKSKELFYAVHEAVRGYGIDRLNEALKAGADSNYCIGENGYFDSNPLGLVAGTIYDTYLRRTKGEKIPEPSPDVETLNILVKSGADINKRPYIWQRVFRFGNYYIEDMISERNAGKKSTKDMKDEIECFVNDSNRIIEAFIKAGADPDMKGHPVPFNYEGIEAKINEEQAKEYFKNGSRPINLAIEKRIFWESQVDLLLQYTKLDEESLKDAERSNDPKMIEKINKLWKEQQSEKN